MSKPLMFVEPETDLTKWVESGRAAGAECLLLTSREHPVAPAGIKVIWAHSLSADSLVEAGQRERIRGVWSDAAEVQLALLEAAGRLRLPHAQPSATPGLLHLLETPMTKSGVPVNPLHPALDLTQAERFADACGMPVWVCAFGAGGRSHCRQVEHADDLPLAFESARRRFEGGLVALQQPLEGECFRVLGFKVRRDFFPVEVLSERFVRGAFRVPRAWSAPCGLGGGEYTEVMALSRKAAAALPPCHGYLELEIILADGRPVLNSLRMPPAPHDLIVSVIRHALGIDLRTQCLRVALGQTPDLNPTRGLGVAACFLTARSGVVEDIRGVAQAAAFPGTVTIALRAKHGDTLGHVVDEATREKVGCAIAMGPTHTAAEHTLERIWETVDVITNSML